MNMFPVNCPKTRNEEFGQLLEALTGKQYYLTGPNISVFYKYGSVLELRSSVTDNFSKKP